jgi:hypothetical protein
MRLPESLLRLDLGRDLDFPLPIGLAGSPALFPEGPDREGGEELHVYPPGLFPADEDGPRCPRPLPPPLSSWSTAAADRESGTGYRLTSGAWLFAQSRPTGPSELEDFLEWFAREAWWERRRLEGPWLLRLVREDGKTAYQLLRRLIETD